ncbi:MAG: UMP kinase [Candidatus Thermoplasmatota archaeon]
MKTIVLSLGGSVVLSDEANPSFLKQIAELLQKISSNYKLYVIVGGGTIARQYINLGRMLGFPENLLDQLGIDITRVNARVLTNLLPDSNKEIPYTTAQAIKLTNKIIVMGGTEPQHSTDLVGAEIAQKTTAERFVNATNVDGIYDKDPKKHPDAKKISEITIDELIKIYGTRWEAAGKNVFMDGPALSVIKKARIPTFIVNGKKLDQLENALLGKHFDGTTILV